MVVGVWVQLPSGRLNSPKEIFFTRSVNTPRNTTGVRFPLTPVLGSSDAMDELWMGSGRETTTGAGVLTASKMKLIPVTVVLSLLASVAVTESVKVAGLVGLAVIAPFEANVNQLGIVPDVALPTYVTGFSPPVLLNALEKAVPTVPRMVVFEAGEICNGCAPVVKVIGVGVIES